MRKITLKDILIIAVIALVGAGGVWAYAFTSRVSTPPTQSTVVALRDIEQHVDLSGQVEPVNKYDLAFATNGAVQKVYVKAGQAVKAGQELAQLDVSDVTMQRAQAKAVLESDQLTANVNLQKAQKARKILLAADVPKLAQAKQAVVDAKSVWTTAKNTLNIFSEPDNKAGTYPAYLSVKQGVVTAQAAYNQARKNLSITEASIKQAEALSELDITSAEATLKLKQNTIDNTGDVSANKANLDYLDAVLNKATLHAPAAGVVTLVDITEGEFATPAKPIITVESTGLQIVAQASQLDIGKLKVGDVATVTFDAYGANTKFMGHVSAIDVAETVVNGNATYKVTLKLDKSDARIKSGLTANVSIVTARHAKAVAVPKEAIIQANGMSTVVVNNGSGQGQRKVTTGLDGADGYVEVTQGLQAGDHIISFGTK